MLEDLINVDYLRSGRSPRFLFDGLRRADLPRRPRKTPKGKKDAPPSSDRRGDPVVPGRTGTDTPQSNEDSKLPEETLK